jgi:hypothetical protein
VTDKALSPKYSNVVVTNSTAWKLRSEKAQYISAFGDLEIAVVLAGVMGQRAFEWFHEKISALDQRSAAGVMQNEPEGPHIVRSFLLRFPSR